MRATLLTALESKRLGAVLLGILALWIVGLQVCGLFLPFVGGYHDDGIYLVTAKSMAEGEGYSIQSLPQPIPQTKYPILFPALLAVIWKIQPDFPSNLPYLLLVPMVSCWLWLGATWWLLAEELGRREFPGWVVALTLASPAVNFLSMQLLTESLFAFLITLTIIFIVRMGRQGGGGLAVVVCGSVVCALAFHTRTIGATLLPAGVLVLVRNRQWWRLLAFVSVFLFLAAPWWIWQSSHPAPEDPILAYYTKRNYADWNLITGNLSISPFAVILQNLIYLAYFPSYSLQLPPFSPLFYLIFLPMPVLLGFGIFRLISTRPESISIFLACYLGAVLTWPWPSGRFLVPIAPLLILAISSFRVWQRSLPVRWAAKAVASTLLIWSVAMTTSNAMASLSSGTPTFSSDKDAASWSERSEAYRWISANTRPDQVLAANLDPSLWIYCRRKAVRAFSVDPAGLFYRPGQETKPLGSARVLADRLIHHQVAYLLFEDSPLFAETKPLKAAIGDLVAQCPSTLQRVFISTGGTVEIYRLSPAPNPQDEAATICAGPMPAAVAH